jgi:hypothetical protein
MHGSVDAARKVATGPGRGIHRASSRAPVVYRQTSPEAPFRDTNIEVSRLPLASEHLVRQGGGGSNTEIGGDASNGFPTGFQQRSRPQAVSEKCWSVGRFMRLLNSPNGPRS